MIILSTPQLRDRLVTLVSNAASVRIATAYLSSEPRLWAALATAKKVEVVVSSEWHINDPAVAQDLVRLGADVREIATDAAGGRLHAKAVVGTLANGDRFATLGSANYTYSGLARHRELSCLLEAANDAPQIADVASLLASWWQSSTPVDWNRAQSVWQSRVRTNNRSSTAARTSGTSNAWLIKTTAGRSGQSYWNEFLAESVIAIGWENIRGDPGAMTPAQVRSALQAARHGPVRAVATIRGFYDEMSVGDSVLVLRGYTGTQTKDVHIFAFGSIESGAYTEPQPSTWWRFKRSAALTPVGIDVDVDLLRNALGLRSCLNTIHSMTPARLRGLRNDMQAQLGLSIPW